MAMNPMQRKANNYLLLGVLGTLVITGSIIALLFMQLNKLQTTIKEDQKNRVDIYVLKQDVKSGQILTQDMFTKKSVNRDLIPANATGDISELIRSIALEDNKGRSISVDNDGMYYTGTRTRILEDGTSYYYENNGNKEYIQLVEAPVIAKIDINRNTVATSSIIAKSTERTTNDLRKQEYNMVILPSQIQSGDFVDIRIRMQNGQDYIVVSKKEITIPDIDGVESEDTIIMNMTEAETLIMSNAIIEAYIDKGALLYATTYVEPGIQDNVTPTYVPSGAVQELMYNNPNIEQTAKATLINRYNQYTSIRNNINNALAQYAQDTVNNIEAGVQEQITKAKQARQAYLESLGGY